MHVILQIISGKQKGEHYALQEGENSIGRSSECSICIEDPTISRHHLSVFIESGKVSLQKFSQRGTLKCDSTDITSIELSKLHKIQIGRVLTKLDLSPPSQAITPQPKQNLQATAQQDLQASNANHELMDLGQEETVLISDEELKAQKELEIKPSKPIYGSILKGLILIILGIIAFSVTRSIDTQDAPTVIFPYKAGVEKLVDLHGYIKRYRIRSFPDTIEIDNPLVMRAQMEPRPLPILRFETLKQGTCTLTLKNQQKQTLLHLKFVVKGAVDSRSDIFTRNNMSEKEIEKKAKELMGRAAIVRQENLYESYQYYEEAIKYLEIISTSSPLYFQCRENMKGPKEALDMHLKDLWSEANRYRKNKSYARALTFVENILDLVKDPYNLHHQRAQIHKKHILRKINP